MTTGTDLDILSFGEALVDFLPNQRGKLRHVDSFHRSIGGAPANLSVGLARLGRRVGLATNVGADEFGEYLRLALQGEGVDVSGVGRTEAAKTGVTFVSLDESGDRSFLFFREPSADMTVTADDVDEALVARSRVTHVGSNLMMKPEPRRATLTALRLAHEHDRLTSSDLNIRLHLWDTPQDTRREVEGMLELLDLVKINDEELAFIGRGAPAEQVWVEQMRPRGVRALAVTHGALGAEFFCGDVHVRVDAPAVDVVDTTGAGDGFMAGLLAGICEIADDDADLREAIAFWSAEQWRLILAFACTAGAKVCEELGATPGLPARDALPALDVVE